MNEPMPGRDEGGQAGEQADPRQRRHDPLPAAEVGDPLAAPPRDEHPGEEEQARRREPVVEHVESSTRPSPWW